MNEKVEKYDYLLINYAKGDVNFQKITQYCDIVNFFL